MPCPACVGWNLPLMQKQYVGPTGIPSAMSYRDWFLYQLHIVHHQGPSHWGGELDSLTALLKLPSFSLSAGDNPTGYTSNA